MSQRQRMAPPPLRLIAGLRHLAGRMEFDRAGKELSSINI
jgi:hypothetical protein